MGVDSCRSLVHMGCERFPCRCGQSVQVCAACASDALVCIAPLCFDSCAAPGANLRFAMPQGITSLVDLHTTEDTPTRSPDRPLKTLLGVQHKTQLAMGMCRLQQFRGP